MTNSTSGPEQEGPTEIFVEQVKDALEHLYDFSYLQRHPLAQDSKIILADPGQSREQGLRPILVAAIESLNPGPDVPFHAVHARLYNLLLLHYVEGTTIQEAAHELGVSRRQAHRDLRRGYENIAAILWGRRKAINEQPRAVQLSSIEVEMARLESHPQVTDIRLLLEGALRAVQPMAGQQEIDFQTEIPPEPVTLSVDVVVARQVLVNLLSFVLGQSAQETITITLADDQEQIILSIIYISSSDGADVAELDPVVVQLVDRLGWTVKQEHQTGTSWTIRLDMTVHGSTILLIDDNEGLVELLKEYLTGQACRVVAATSGSDGLRLAEKLAPDAILLDVMIPEMDGWELLQRLRHHPQTAKIPVIICSVLNNPDLAHSLGASLFLPKPVSRNDVLTALRQLGVV